MTCYASTNFLTKKALKDAVTGGLRVRIRELTPMGDRVPLDGKYAVSGPWYPQPHKWYAECVIVDGAIVSVK